MSIRSFAIPAFILIGLFWVWNFGTPRMFHDVVIPPGTVALKPEGSLPTFHSVQSRLSRGSHDGEAVGDGVPPNNANENIFKRNRDSTRRSTMKGLEQAWSTYCTSSGRGKLAHALNNYFASRGNEIDSYSRRWGKDGHDYITTEWSTTDDHRIERLVAETYERGYLDLSSLRGSTVERMMPLLKEVQVQDQPCKR